MEKISIILKKSKALTCPKCGQGAMFNGIVSLKNSCPNCSFIYKIGNKGWTGPALINSTATVVLVLFSTLVGLLVLRGNYAKFVVAGAILLGISLNFLLYRYAHSFWIYLLYFSKMDKV
ncbi:MAG: hypothetical protein JJV97_04925 [SAR324 cluster bacterium]|nr:hypothetical protein [SAR324 cluster bacterium]